MGRTHHESISLDDLIRMSPHIVIAQATEPFTETDVINLGQEIEPYSYLLYRYKVIAPIHPKKAPKAGEVLIISSFDEGEFRRHAEYAARGLSRSPIIKVYQEPGSSDLDPEAPRILFLKRHLYQEYDMAENSLSGRTDTFASVAWGAVEDVAKKRKIGKVAKAAKTFGTLEITVGSPKKTESIKDKIGDLLAKKFPNDLLLNWTLVETRPNKSGSSA